MTLLRPAQPSVGPVQRVLRALEAAAHWLRLGTDTPPRDRWRDWLLVAIVLVPMVFNAIALWPEVA
jgi:hypothetical protein